MCTAPWCNWLTRGPFKAESPGSSPGGATKIKDLRENCLLELSDKRTGVQKRSAALHTYALLCSVLPFSDQIGGFWGSIKTQLNPGLDPPRPVPAAQAVMTLVRASSKIPIHVSINELYRVL